MRRIIVVVSPPFPPDRNRRKRGDQQQREARRFGHDGEHEVIVVNGQVRRQSVDRAAPVRPQLAIDRSGVDERILARPEAGQGGEVEVGKLLAVEVERAAGHQDFIVSPSPPSS